MTYPSRWEADVVLADGGTVQLRPIRPDDADPLRAMHSRLSPDTVYMRFFSMVRTVSAREVERLTTVDYDDRVAVVAVLRDEIVGVTRYDRLLGTADAEVAVVVEDAHQGRGLGPLLLEHLAAAGEEQGIERFVANVLPSNRRMLEVFRTAGFEVERHMADGFVELVYPIRQTSASREVARAREHRAEARSVARLLSPKAVAVVGASRERGTAGHEVFRSLIAHGFEGPVYPVNPIAPHVASVRAYADVRDVPDDVDLAVIAVPAALVEDVVRACTEKRVRGLVVVSGGFADGGEEGRERLERVVRIARDGGLRLIGPNAMGVVNTDPAVSLHATFAEGTAPVGRVGVFSQSGALAGTVLAEVGRRSLGLSTFVSIGDRADVSGNDLLQYWQQDPHTDVVGLHLQGFGNPRKFARIARVVGHTKPVVALKSGRGAGDAAVDALFASSGVIRVDTLVQLFETAQLLAVQPLPAGRRVGVVGTSSALAALAADSCRAAGLDLVRLSEPVQASLRALVGTTETANPVDLGPLAEPTAFATALELLVTSGEVDAVLAVITPHLHADSLAGALVEAARGGLPVLASFLGHNGVPPELAVPGPRGEVAGFGSVPSYASPEPAAMALARAASYAAWRARPQGVVPTIDVDTAAARGLLEDRAVRRGVGPDRGAAARRLRAVDLAHRAGRDPGRGAGRCRPAGLAGGAQAPGREVAQPHRRRRGAAVDRHARGAGQCLGGAAGAARALPAAGPADGAVRGLDRRTAGAGPGGRAAGVRPARWRGGRPARRPGDAHAAADRQRRDRPGRLDPRRSLLVGTDTAALEDVLHRMARLAEDLPEVAEVLLDPVLVGRSGVTVLHAGVRLLPPGADPERGPRQLVGHGAEYLRT